MGGGWVGYLPFPFKCPARLPTLKRPGNCAACFRSFRTVLKGSETLWNEGTLICWLGGILKNTCSGGQDCFEAKLAIHTLHALLSTFGDAAISGTRAGWRGIECQTPVMEHSGTRRWWQLIELEYTGSSADDHSSRRRCQKRPAARFSKLFIEERRRRPYTWRTFPRPDAVCIKGRSKKSCLCPSASSLAALFAHRRVAW